MSGAWPVRTADLACVYKSALGMKLSFTEHCGFAASNSRTLAVTQSFLAGSSGQLLHIVIWTGSAAISGCGNAQQGGNECGVTCASEHVFSSRFSKQEFTVRGSCQ